MADHSAAAPTATATATTDDAEAVNPFAPPQATLADVEVVPDHVVPATRLSRFLAAMIDYGAVMILAFAGGVATALLGYRGGEPPTWLIILVGVLGLAFMVQGIVSLVMFHQTGQTVGKRAMGIRVVRGNGERISFGRALLLRWIAPYVLFSLPRWLTFAAGGAIATAGGVATQLLSLANVLFIFGASRRCLHDRIADSQVVTAASSRHATRDAARWRT